MKSISWNFWRNRKIWEKVYPILTCEIIEKITSINSLPSRILWCQSWIIRSKIDIGLRLVAIRRIRRPFGHRTSQHRDLLFFFDSIGWLFKGSSGFLMAGEFTSCGSLALKLALPISLIVVSDRTSVIWWSESPPCEAYVIDCYFL